MLELPFSLDETLFQDQSCLGLLLFDLSSFFVIRLDEGEEGALLVPLDICRQNDDLLLQITNLIAEAGDLVLKQVALLSKRLNKNLTLSPELYGLTLAGIKFKL